MKRAAHGGGASDPSAYWREELENIDYLIEASPLIVRKLRHHAFHITGIRPYDYRSKGDGRREHFEARLRALRALGGERLLVPESPALGGFGYEIDGRLFNVDTLKFYEVLIGMERGGVLAAARERRSAGGLRDRARVGGLRLSVQDAVSARHLRDRGLSRAVPVLGDLPGGGVSRRPPALGRPSRRRRRSDGLARRRLRVRAEHLAPSARSAAARPDGQHGVVPGDDRRAGARLRRHRPRARAVRCSTA